MWDRTRARLVPVAVFALAAVLRLGRLDLVEFKADEVRHCQLALSITEEGRLPVIGSSGSVGISKPALMPYLLAIPLSVSRDPKVASGFIALLNVAAVAGCYLVASRYFGRRAALVGSLLYAVNPWAIVYSRKVFTADVLAPFTVLMLFGLCESLVRRRPWGMAIAAISLGCLLLITFSPLPLIVVLGILVLVYRRRVSWPHLVIGCGVSLVLFLPYLWYDSRLGFTNLRGLLAGSGGEGGAAWGSQSLQLAGWIHSGYNLASLAGKAYPAYVDGRVPLGWLDLAAMASLAVALGYVMKQAACRWQRGGDGASYVILASWLVIPVGFLTLNPVKLHPHYLVILYPVGYIALGVLWDGALSWAVGRGGGEHLIRGLVWLVIGSLVAWQVYVTCYTLDFVATHDTTGGYGLPLSFVQGAATLAQEKAREEGVGEVWVITEGSDLSWEEMPLVLNYLLEPSVEAAFLGQGGHTCVLLPVDRPAVYLVTRQDAKALNTIMALGGEPRGEVIFPAGQGRAEVIVVPALATEQVLGLPSVPRDDRLDAGLTLVGYDWPDGARSGETEDLITYWAFGEIGADVSREQHSIFNHLVDGRGKKWAQLDGLGLAERHWKDGYVLMQWFSLALPSDMPGGEYHVVTGLYRLQDGRRSLLLDGRGQPVGDAIELGPLTVGAP